MKALLIGGTGLVGSTILDALCNNGYEVTASYKTARNVLDKRANWVQLNMCDPDAAMSIINSLGKHDVLIHNAAIINTANSLDGYNNIIKANITFTGYLFKWAENNISKLVMFMSSLSFVAKPLPVLITEDVNCLTSNVYSFSKFAGEQMLSYISDASIRKVVFRLSSPVGKRLDLMPNTVVKKWIEQARQNKKITVFGRGEREQNFVSTEDIATAIISTIKSENSMGLFNIASGTTLSMKKLATLIADKLGADIEYKGIDTNETDKWSISIRKASESFNYKPLNSELVIQALLNRL